ncbi:MAG: CarD family transcriptional regulator, partial [Oscillospiraceae bacterium]|nr:CarD family transcriptional regulator [Oscillospiraceae bacterium]
LGTETVAGSTQDYYVFHMPVGGLVLKIPTASGELVGLRDVWEEEESLRLLQNLPTLEAQPVTGSWNQRNRETMEKLKSGDLYQVAQVIKNLTCRDQEKGLSTGERKMLRTAKQILITEMVLSIGQSYQQIEEQVNLSIGGA